MAKMKMFKQQCRSFTTARQVKPGEVVLLVDHVMVDTKAKGTWGKRYREVFTPIMRLANDGRHPTDRVWFVVLTGGHKAPGVIVDMQPDYSVQRTRTANLVVNL